MIAENDLVIQGGGILAGLSGQYLSLLIAIQEKPFGTIEELAARANISKPTAAKRLRLLQGEGGTKRYFVVNPLLNYYSLGLESIDVLVETSDLEGTKTIEKLAQAHPYTAYRCRTYGAVNGVFLQFRTPFNSSSMIHDLIQSLKKEGIIERYQFISTDYESPIYTSLRINGWDPDTLSWDFDWERWFKKKVKPQESRKTEEVMGRALKWLTRRDLSIIYELMKGARRKNTQIIEALAKSGVKFTPQTFSRRYRMIREECIEGYRVTFDPSAFDIYSNLIIFGNGGEEYLKILRARLEKSPIPFESTLKTVGSELLWFIRLQPTHMSALLTNLYAQLEDMSVSIADYSHSLIYYIWPETLDEINHRWRTDRKFMVNDVLEAVLE